MNKEGTPVVDGEVIESGALVIKANEGLTPSEKIAQVTAAVAQMQALQKVVRGAALGCTRAGDWRSWNGRLRPEVSAADSIAAMFGVKISEVMTEKKVTAGGYQVIAYGTFMLPLSGFAIENVMGSCLSSDPIVATRYGKDEEGNRVEQTVASNDVDEATVTKKALANLRVNGIMSLFGLRNVTPEELMAVGIDLGKGGTKGVQHSNAAWEIKDAQVGLLRKFHATQAEIDGCKSNGDITTLLNKLKAEKRKAAPAETTPSTIEPPTGTDAGGPAENPMLGIIDNIWEMAGVVKWDKEITTKKIADAEAKGLPAVKLLQQSMAELCKAARR